MDARSSHGLCPVTSDASSVPAQQCFRGDEPTGAFRAGERGSDRAEQSPVVIAEGGSCGLATKTVSWWRNMMISRSLERSERTASRARAAMRQ
jgi:hypothetical protein